MTTLSYIQVALHPQGQVINLPLVNGSLRKQTLLSQYPGATGLKYQSEGRWIAVNLENDEFKLPDSVETTNIFVVVTNVIGTGHQIIGRPNLASHMSDIFHRGPASAQSASPSTSFSPRSTAAYAIDTRGNIGRKAARSLQISKKRAFSKTYKLSFIKDVQMPVALSRTVTLVDGMITLNSTDDECTIKTKLLSILNSSLEASFDRMYTVDELKYLSCSERKLSVPHVSSDFNWNAENLRTNIGQGKLYVQVISQENQTEISEDELPDPQLPLLTRHAREQRRPVLENDTGTPTVTFKARRQGRRCITNLHANTVSGQEQRNTFLSYGEYTRHVVVSAKIEVERIILYSASTLIVSRKNSYASLFSDEVNVISDSDEDTADVVARPNQESLQTLQEELVTLRRSLDLEKTTRFNINRNDVLDGTRRALHRASFRPEHKFSVKFTDDCGNSEGAVDEGGPKRELLRLLMTKIQQMNIFEGPLTSRQIALNPTALGDGLYKDVGKIISMSVVHGGPPPRFFSELLFSSLVLKDVGPTLDDLSDDEIKDQIEKLMKAINLNEIEICLQTMALILSVSGCWRPVTNMDQKDQLVKDLLKFFVLGRTCEARTELASGMEALGVLKRMKSNPTCFRQLFVHSENKMTALMMEAIFSDIKFSPEGSNQKVIESRIIGYWRDFLLDIEEAEDSRIVLADVLVFATGADVVPPLGFEPLPSITFTTDRYPMANTCGMVLRLPDAPTYNLFKDNMIFGIQNSRGFGNA